MSLDPRIPLGVNPAPTFDIMGAMQRAAQMKRLDAISQNEQQEMALRQKEAQENEQFKQIFAEPGITQEQALQRAKQINPIRAMALQKLFDDQALSAETLKGRQLENTAKTKEQEENDAFKAVLTETPDWEQAKPRLMAINPKRTLEFEKLQREAQKKSLQHVDVVGPDGKLQASTFDPDTGIYTPSGLVAAGQIDDERAAAAEARQAAAQRSTELHQRRMEAKPTGDGGALVAIVGPDGKPVLVPRSQAVGKTPASTRDSGGGRGVTSGDAGRIADFDTSIDDVDVLRKTVSVNKATGTRAAIGAALPNAVTEYTGWGAEAKDKQAVIDRVKQVIGKALEGGVLRKEDEYKYTKILPTISDPTSLVVSKLAGLEQAIKLRKERLLDSLDDAGYNTESYKARQPKPEKYTKPRFEIISVK